MKKTQEMQWARDAAREALRFAQRVNRRLETQLTNRGDSEWDLLFALEQQAALAEEYAYELEEMADHLEGTGPAHDDENLARWDRETNGVR